MVQIGGNLPGILAGRKSTSDFMREAEEFEARKRANALAEQAAQLGLIKTQRDLAKPEGAFSGEGFDAQIGNVAYERYLSEGLDPMSAKQRAVDDVLRTKVDYGMATDPYTGQQIPIAKPRNTLFGGGANTPAPNTDASYSLDVDNSPQALGGALGVPPEEIVAMLNTGGNSNQDPNRPPTLPVGDVLKMPAAQGAAMDIDPRAKKSPEVQIDLAKKANEIALKSQDPEFLLKARDLGLKEEDAKQKMEKTKLAAEQITSVIGDLIDENGNLRPGVEQIVGGPMGLRGRQSSIMPVTEAQRKYQPYINQITGQAFLQAFEALKGGGQITQIEGEKATQAITRLAQYQTPEDFAQALKDLKEYAQKVKKTTGGSVVGQEKATTSVDDLINKYAD